MNRMLPGHRTDYPYYKVMLMSVHCEYDYTPHYTRILDDLMSATGMLICEKSSKLFTFA